jgi:hypothetical protein
MPLILVNISLPMLELLHKYTVSMYAHTKSQYAITICLYFNDNENVINMVSFEDIATCRVVRVMKITGLNRMIGFINTSVTISLNYN